MRFKSSAQRKLVMAKLRSFIRARGQAKRHGRDLTFEEFTSGQHDENKRIRQLDYHKKYFSTPEWKLYKKIYGKEYRLRPEFIAKWRTGIPRRLKSKKFGIKYANKLEVK